MLPAMIDGKKSNSKWDMYVVNIKKGDKTRLPKNLREGFKANTDITQRGFDSNEIQLFPGSNNDIWIEATSTEAFSTVGQQENKSFRPYRNFKQLKNRPAKMVTDNMPDLLHQFDDVYVNLFNDILTIALKQQADVEGIGSEF